MTLPATGTLSISQVRTELNLSGALNLGNSSVRTLAQVSSGPISMSSLRGKSASTTTLLSGTLSVGFDGSSIWGFDAFGPIGSYTMNSTTMGPYTNLSLFYMEYYSGGAHAQIGLVSNASMAAYLNANMTQFVIAGIVHAYSSTNSVDFGGGTWVNAIYLSPALTTLVGRQGTTVNWSIIGH